MVKHRTRAWQAGMIATVVLALVSGEADAQTKKQGKPSKAPESPLFQDAIARAAKSKQPLVMFGVSEGCQRCAALKEGLSGQSEIKELMTQYVSAEIPFGGKEFSAVYSEIIRQDAKYNQPIGAPSVFIFTAKGDVVYAGPNDPNGMQAGEAFKKLLREGIEKNKGTGKAAK